jgi:hypothetical protein
VRSGALNTVDKRGMVFIESTAEGQDGHFFELCQSARTRRNAGTALTPMDFKFFFSPWHEDDAYTLPAGSAELPASTLNYRKEWDEDRATFRDRPFHNWASHGADAFRTFAQGFVEPEMVRPRGRYRSRHSGGGSWESM